MWLSFKDDSGRSGSRGVRVQEELSRATHKLLNRPERHTTLRGDVAPWCGVSENKYMTMVVRYTTGTRHST